MPLKYVVDVLDCLNNQHERQTMTFAELTTPGGYKAGEVASALQKTIRRCQEQELKRPLRRELAEFQRLYDARRPCYLKAAVRIETGGKDVEEVADETIKSLGLTIG